MRGTGLLFLGQFARSPHTVGAILPSSPALANTMLAPPKTPVTADELRLNPVSSLTMSFGRLDDCHEPVLIRPAGL